MKRTKQFFGFGVSAVLLALGLLLPLAGCGEAGDAEDSAFANFSITLPDASLDGKGPENAVTPDLLGNLNRLRVDYKGPVTSGEDFTLPAESMELTLTRGEYEFTVTGYKGDRAIATSAAKTASSSGGTVQVFIGPNTDSSLPDGSFTWDIKLDEGFQSISLLDLNNDEEEALDVPLKTQKKSENAFSLAPGSYRMVAAVNTPSLKNYVAAVHIYAGLTTAMVLDATCFVSGPDEDISIKLKNNAVTSAGDVLTVDPDIEDGEWYIDGELVVVPTDGVTADSFNWAAVSEARHFDIDTYYTVRFEGHAGSVWFSYTEDFLRDQPASETFYVKADADSAYRDGTATSRPFKTLEKALAAPALESVKTIVIIGDYAIDKSGTYTESGAVTTTIIRDATSGTGDAVITVNGGAVVTFSNVTINGDNEDGENSYRGLLVTGAGTSVTLENTTVTGKTTADGGGVYVTAGATLVMATDSTVTGSSAENGGGVAVAGATFNMEGGTISLNAALGDGGGVHVTSNNASLFRITGGIIYGTGAQANIATNAAAFFKGTNGRAYKGVDETEPLSTTDDSDIQVGE
jgi:hypothetical protein